MNRQGKETTRPVPTHCFIQDSMATPSQHIAAAPVVTAGGAASYRWASLFNWSPSGGRLGRRQSNDTWWCRESL